MNRTSYILDRYEQFFFKILSFNGNQPNLTMKTRKFLFRFFISLFIMILTIALSYSQSIALNYNSTGTGQNITANFSFDIKKSELGFGLGYTISTLAHPDNQYNVFYKRQFATEPLHHLNLNLFYHRYVFPNLDHINIFLFYDFQGKHSAARNVINSPLDDVIYHGPYYWLDNTIGLGFNVNIIGNWYVQQKIGAGGHFIIPSNKDASRVDSEMYFINNFHWEIIGLLNIGIVYKL